MVGSLIGHSVRKLLPLVILAIIFGSCSPAVQENIQSNYEQVVPPKDVAVFKPGWALPEDGEKIGSVEISDTGFSTDCTLDKVVSLARDKASQMGGHAIKLTNVNEPDLASTCYRIDAGVYRYPVFNVSEDTEVKDISESEISKYFEENKDNLDPVEGIWTFSESVEFKRSGEISENKNVYELAIMKKDLKSEREYDIVTISSENDKWDKVGLLKGVVEKTAYSDVYNVEWINANGTKENTNFNLEDEGLITAEFTGRVYEASANLIKKYPPIGNKEEEKRESKVSRGTGFVVSRSGLIVTNNHVVSNSESVKVKFNNKNKQTLVYNTSVIINKRDSDLAILKVEDEEFEEFAQIPYGMSNDYSSGQKVFTLGYPMTNVMGENVKVTEGIISATDGPTDGNVFMQTSVPIQPGNSGGPLFNMNGNIVGITTATLNESVTGVDTENVNYSIKSKHLTELVSVLTDFDANQLKERGQKNSLSKYVERYSPYICIVEATVE